MEEETAWLSRKRKKKRNIKYIYAFGHLDDPKIRSIDFCRQVCDKMDESRID